MPSPIPNTFCKSLNISSFFLWNMSPVEAASNDNFLYLSLPIRNTNVVSMIIFHPVLGCDNQKSHLQKTYCALFGFGTISLSVDHLWTSLMSARFSFIGSRHNLTFPLGFCTNTELLPHSAISSTSSAVIMSCCWSHSNSSLSGFCRV